MKAYVPDKAATERSVHIQAGQHCALALQGFAEDAVERTRTELARLSMAVLRLVGTSLVSEILERSEAARLEVQDTRAYEDTDSSDLEGKK